MTTCPSCKHGWWWHGEDGCESPLTHFADRTIFCRCREMPQPELGDEPPWSVDVETGGHL